MKLRILVVDNDEKSRVFLFRVLSWWGYEVITAENGREAIDILCAEPIHVVITENPMPEVDGITLCRWIRSQAFPWYVYVIVVTDNAGAADVVESLAAGCDEFLAKPVDSRELHMRVRTAERILALESRQVTIVAVARLAESRDPDTGRHLDRIREYTRVLTRHLRRLGHFSDEITAAYVELLYQTSPLHDIGKVGIPDSILLKPGRLTAEERNVMKLHTVIGGETLGAALAQCPGMEYLRIARDIALTHHERYDGTGYPYGLSGNAIPLCGRIVALCDVYDALISQRVYKKAFPHQAARSIIMAEAGTRFDPCIVQAFLNAEKEILEIVHRFAEHSVALPIFAEVAG